MVKIEHEMSIKEFSINDINLFKNDDNVDFAIAELEFMSDGDNGQNSPITLEAIKRDSKTVLGKFIVAKYDNRRGDVTTHVPDEIICGYVPPDSEVFFREKDGRTFAVCQAVISKLYATEIFLLFKKDNYRAVSAEFSAVQPNPNEFGEGEITAFDIRAITILGKNVDPAIRNANMQIKQFSMEEAKEFYNEQNSPLKEFAEKRRAKMETKTYKVNKTELKETPWGDINKTELKNKIMEAKNKNTLVHSVYLLVEDGWEDAPSDNLKYPVMQLDGNTFYYNRHGMSSAYGYAKAEGEEEVIAKLNKLYKKFKLDIPEDDSERKEEKKEMADKKFSQLEGREIYAEVIKRVQTKLGKDMYVEEVYTDHIEVKNERTGEMYKIPADIKIGKDDEEMSISIDYDSMKKAGAQKQFSEEDKKEEKETKEEKKFDDEDDHEEDKDEVEEEADEDLEDDEPKEQKKATKKATKKTEKKYSLDVHADEGAMLSMLEQETEENEKLAEEDGEELKKLWASKDLNVIMEKTYSLMKEVKKLKEFKSKTEESECEAEFAQCMSKVKGKIEGKEYEKFYEEGKEIKEKDKMKEFSLRVKAFAYDHSIEGITEHKDNTFRFGGRSVDSDKPNENLSVFDRISRK